MVLDEYVLSEIENHNLANSNVRDLTEEVKSLISSGSLKDEERATAYFSLGKLFEPKLKGYFQNRLKLEVEKNTVAIYQLLICLDNIDKPVFGADRNGSYSYNDYELNLRDARQYIKNET